MPSRRELANAIRFLSADAVQKANSGHPGMPMGMADIAEVLWNDFLHHNPADPNWPNRDRFVLSNGHGSMLLYSLLHLTGYADMTLDQIKNFRQLHSITPGHPEYGLAAGIETTTGPLGQGLANAVGMAIAERVLAEQFNEPSHTIIDHYTYVFLGDGCLMEGISHEACSLAGHLRLNKLIAFWDDNGISIDGKTAGWFTDDTPMRFRAYDWHVITDIDGHNSEQIHQAIIEAKQQKNKPVLICCKTTIGFGSPNIAGSEKAHGAALGVEEVKKTRAALNWRYDEFVIPEDYYQVWDAREKGAQWQQQWQQQWQAYQQAFPAKAKELTRRLQHQLPEEFAATVAHFIQEQQKAMSKQATRQASQACLNAYGTLLPELLGGSADLTGSNNTRWHGSKTITATDFSGNYIYYGVREFAMSAIMNGMALHGGFLPYGGTFLVFADYARNAIRLAALMKQRVVFVLTHDSIGLGEDGPTHQPVEHLTMLRATPNLHVWRPGDSVETAVAWEHAIKRLDGPTCLALTRQAIPAQDRDESQLQNIGKGGYILKDCEGTPEFILLATGSELSLAVDAYAALPDKKIRVISMPCAEVFLQQSAAYQQQVLPNSVRKRLAIEAASPVCWYQFVGLDGKIIGLDRFGESAPAEDVFAYFGFTKENIVESLLNW